MTQLKKKDVCFFQNNYWIDPHPHFGAFFGIGAAIHIGREIQCLLCAGFSLTQSHIPGDVGNKQKYPLCVW